jgi:hypothetical protein
MEDSPISRAIRRMARKACGLPEEDEKKSRSGVLGWAKRGFTKSGPAQKTDPIKEVATTFAPGRL